MDDIGTKGADTDWSKFGVAHHDRVHRSPFEVGELAHRAEIDFREKRTVESELPALKCREYRKVMSFQREHAGLKNIGNTAFIDKNRRLPFPHRQLCAVFDLIVIALESIHHRVVGIVRPLNDIDKLATHFVPKAHSALRWKSIS